MEHTLVFGTPVGSESHSFGKLAKIVIENGVANQIVVHPGLFGGPERVVPINDLVTSTHDHIGLDVDGESWKAYSAYRITTHRLEQPGSSDAMPMARGVDIAAGLAEPGEMDTSSTMTTVTDNAVVLDHTTRVGDIGALRGLVISTGIPQALLVDNDAIPYGQVSLLDSQQIQLGGASAAPLSLDQPTQIEPKTP
ncbi:MAG: hypothetical protein NVS4B8_19160 [Herpetosiphon sp.]